MSSIISISLDSLSSFPPNSTLPPDTPPNFSTQDEFFDFLNQTQDDDELQFFGTCNKTLFEEEAPGETFPGFSNTKAIVSAHTKIWRAGHTKNILMVITGTKDERIDYITGLVVSSITVFIVFIAWMVLLITLKGFGRNRVGLLSGRREELPPRPPSGYNPKSAATGIADIDIDADNKEEKALDAAKQDANDDEMEGGDVKKVMAPSVPSSLASEDFLASSVTTSGAEPSGKSDKGPRLSSEEYLVSSTTSGAEVSGEEELESPETGINGKSSATLKSSERMSIIKKLPWSQHRSIKEDVRKEQLVLSSDEWEHLYATKRNEGCWMKVVVVFACAIIIAMSLVMAQKGVQSLRGSLNDGKTSINYAATLLTGAEGVVDDLATGLGSFQVDVLDLLERTNKGICPKLKPQGICPRLLEVDSCDFTIHIDLEKNVTIDKLGVNTTVDLDREFSIDVSNVTDAIKEKIGLDGTIDLRELLFPDAPEVFSDLIKTFSSNWTFVDKMHDLADQINSIASVAFQTGDQVETIAWVFYIAVAFDVLVGVLAACMIVHILMGKRMPRSLQCIQRRCLFPLFITCVSLAFIFANVFLIVSMVLSDTCVNDPNERVKAVLKYYLGNGLGTDYVMEFVEHWMSQCDADSEPLSIQEDQQFFDQAKKILERLDGAVQNFTEDATEFCGTTDKNLFADIIATSLKYLCDVIGLSLDIRTAFQCKTWMPLYYSTVYSALCYNGTAGVWSIAATQFTTVLMACIILTFRSVFFELEIIESDNSAAEECSSSLEEPNQNNKNEEKKENVDQ